MVILIPLSHFFSNHNLQPQGYCIVKLFPSAPVVAKIFLQLIDASI